MSGTGLFYDEYYESHSNVIAKSNLSGFLKSITAEK